MSDAPPPYLQFFGPDDLVVAATRYFMGRYSIETGVFAKQLAAAWPDLPRNVRRVLRRDLQHEFRADTRMRNRQRERDRCLPLGQDVDRACWHHVRLHWTLLDTVSLFQRTSRHMKTMTQPLPVETVAYDGRAYLVCVVSDPETGIHVFFLNAEYYPVGQDEISELYWDEALIVGSRLRPVPSRSHFWIPDTPTESGDSIYSVLHEKGLVSEYVERVESAKGNGATVCVRLTEEGRDLAARLRVPGSQDE